ncbi:2-oxoacid:acceptor oxidoreductase family protein [Candidatus Woesearchaeota archaeon]|nr:2-oxoacid:acceptor oxidoreductase family protein [Candidatus Woesearchaeota archaeon]
MTKDIFEIRFHGRGGQGAKTAAALLAEAALEQGKQVQSFPEYGAERQGAPVKAFVRISDKPIWLHTSVKQPDLVVVVDPTLVKSVAVADGLSHEGTLIVNTTETADDIRKKTGFPGKIVVIDATKIAIEELGRPVTNTAMLGAIEKVTNIVDVEVLKSYATKHFTHKLGDELTRRNLNAFMRAYNEVQA